MIDKIMIELPLLQLGITLGLGALVFYVKTIVREGNDKTDKLLAKLQLEIHEQMSEFKVQIARQSAESQGIHHDMERRISVLERFYADINTQLNYLRQNTTKLLHQPREGAGD